MRNNQSLFALLFVSATACGQVQYGVRVEQPAQTVRSEIRADKSADLATVELELAKAAMGSERAAGNVQRVLLAQAKNLDRRDGGLFAGPINEPHAKPTLRSAEVLRLSALAHRQFGTKKLRQIAESIAKYLETTMMSTDGAFYAGQSGIAPAGVDADVYFAMSASDRAAIGAPEIDRRVLTQENAAVIRALATLHHVTGDTHALAIAQRAMAWLVLNGRTAVQASNVQESVAVGQAMIALYVSTKDARFLDSATAIAEQITAVASSTEMLAAADTAEFFRELSRIDHQKSRAVTLAVHGE